MKPMMTDVKYLSGASAMEDRTYIMTASPEMEMPMAKKTGLTKKHILYAISAVSVVALVLIAILIGMYMFTETQKEIVRFSLQFKGSNNDKVNQEVESDPNDNVVMYHVTKSGQDAYVVNDFNRGMQIVKMASPGKVGCYVTALNRSTAMNPSLITGSESMTSNEDNIDEVFAISNEPVSDHSFLTKKAQNLCKGVSLYWVTKQSAQPITINGTALKGDRPKRDIYQLPSVFGLRGLGGCCKAHYACGVVMLEYIEGGEHTCLTYHETGTCCTPSAQYPIAATHPHCMYFYALPWETPGLNCKKST